MGSSEGGREQGSFTVEAALIFPVILLTVFALIYMGLLLYEKAYIKSVAHRAADRGAAVWDNPAKDVMIGSVTKAELNMGGLYWQIWDTDVEEKKQKIVGYVDKQLQLYSILNGDHEINVQVNNYVGYKTLVVNIKNEYKIPIARLLKPFGIEEYYTIHGRGKTGIHDPVELMRNIDFIGDVGKEIYDENPKLQQITDNIRDMIESIGEKLSFFFKERG